MGNIVLTMSVSADGFIEGPDRDIGWHLVDDELHRDVNQVLAGMGAFLSGRVTYELMAGFWPTADAEPDSSPPMVEFAGIWRDTPKVVYSRTLERADWNTTIVREVDPDEVRRLAARTDGDLPEWGRPGRRLPPPRPDRRVPGPRPPGRHRPGQAPVRAGRHPHRPAPGRNPHLRQRCRPAPPPPHLTRRGALPWLPT
jgi:dihydrofolate reductase